MRKRLPILFAAVLLSVAMLASCIRGGQRAEPAAPQGKIFYCSPSGSDSPQAGSAEKPWKTVGYALGRLAPAGGATLVLADGNYGKLSGGWKFEAPVTVRARNRLKAGMSRLTLSGAKNITFEGIVFDRKSAESAKNVVHLHYGTSYCTFRDCVITHGGGGYDNTDALKLNARTHHILIEDNVIFDGTDEEVDILGDVHDLVFRRNVIYQSKVRKAEALVSNKRNTYRVMFDGNLFANLNPEASNGALRFGGSQHKGQESHTLIALGNLFVNTQGRGAMTFVGAKQCLVAGNVFINHDDARTGAVAIYTNYPKDGIANDELFLIHNVFYNARKPWTQPVFAFLAALPKKWRIEGNLYWNAGKAVPKDERHDPSTEKGALLKDPLFVVGPGKLTGRPSREWFKGLRLRKDSPFHKNAVDLGKLKLPEGLKRFLEDYRTGRRDPWYRAIRAGEKS